MLRQVMVKDCNCIKQFTLNTILYDPSHTFVACCNRDIRGVRKIGILLYFKPETNDCGPEVQLNRNSEHFTRCEFWLKQKKGPKRLFMGQI